jgi:hypothetical protein
VLEAWRGRCHLFAERWMSLGSNPFSVPVDGQPEMREDASGRTTVKRRSKPRPSALITPHHDNEHAHTGSRIHHRTKRVRSWTHAVQRRTRKDTQRHWYQQAYLELWNPRVVLCVWHRRVNTEVRCSHGSRSGLLSSTKRQHSFNLGETEGVRARNQARGRGAQGMQCLCIHASDSMRMQRGGAGGIGVQHGQPLRQRGRVCGAHGEKRRRVGTRGHQWASCTRHGRP